MFHILRKFAKHSSLLLVINSAEIIFFKAASLCILENYPWAKMMHLMFSSNFLICSYFSIHPNSTQVCSLLDNKHIFLLSESFWFFLKCQTSNIHNALCTTGNSRSCRTDQKLLLELILNFA